MTREEFNNALRTAVSSEFEQITDDIPKHVFSARFERRMNRLLRSVKKYGTTPLRAFYKRAAIAAASVSILIIATTQVRAIREPIVNFITKIYDIYKEITFEGDVSSTIICEYTLGYIPEDFCLTSYNKSPSRILYKYTNSTNDYFEFSQGITKDTCIFMDNEKTTAKPLGIVGIEATLYTFEDITYVQWIQDTYFMRITCRGSFEESEIIKMVESIRTVEADVTSTTDTTTE